MDQEALDELLRLGQEIDACPPPQKRIVIEIVCDAGDAQEVQDVAMDRLESALRKTTHSLVSRIERDS